MKKLWVTFSLRLGLALFLATAIPIIILFVLIGSGLVESSYEVGDGETDALSTLISSTPSRLNLEDPANIIIDSPISRSETSSSVERLPLVFDPASNTFHLEIRAPSSVVLTSQALNFQIKLPAWLVIVTLPLLSMVTGILLSIWLSRSITRPVTQLAEAAQAVGRRDLSRRLKLKGSRELQDLAHSFNRMAEDLERAEKNRRSMTADIAHELRTPLAILEGNLRAMLDGVHPANEEEVALLYEQTHHLSRLVEDLRDLALSESARLSLHREPVDLGRLISETAEHFKQSAREGKVKLEVDLASPLIHPLLDESRMRQVLHNLLANALHHTPGGGKVTLSGRRSPQEQGLIIKVADTGEGISKADLPHVFDRYYRSGDRPASSQAGMGLGLTIARALVEAQGGTISVKSAGKNKGSTFTIVLPFHQPN